MTRIYRELDFDLFEFRILELYPDAPGAQIRCAVRHEKLTDPPSYTALSYCCGDPDVTTDIIVNDEVLPVTLNLNSALQYCRQAGERFLWADAICINQWDAKEKGHQIRQMNLVYSRATNTIAWLGDSPISRAPAAVEFLQQLNQHIETRYINRDAFLFRQRRHQLKRDSRASRPWLPQTLYKQLDSGTGEEADRLWTEEDSTVSWLKSGFEATSDLFNCEYWTRRWIIQEIAVSRQANVVYLDTVIRFDDLARAVELCESFNIWPDEQREAYEHIRTIWRLQQSYQSGNSLRLVHVLNNTTQFNSRDQRDRIFALLGLCTDAKSLVPLPSYQQDTGLLIRDLTRAMIQHQVPMDIIYRGVGCNSTIPNSPSWSPNWLAPSFDKDLIGYAGISRPLHDSDTIRRALSAEINTLTLRGVILGTVVQISSVISLNGSTADAATHETASGIHSAVSRYYKRTLRAAFAECLTNNLFKPVHTDQKSSGFVSAERAVQMIAHCVRGRSNRAKWEFGWSFRQPRTNVKDLTDCYVRWLRENQKVLKHSNTMGFLSKRAEWSYHLLAWTEVGVTLVVALILFSLLLWATLRGWIPVFMIVIAIILGVVLLFVISITIIWVLSSINERKARAALQIPRRLFICDSGIMGMACAEVQLGDQITLLGGCTEGGVLRHVDPGDNTKFRVVGPAKPCLSPSDYEKYTMLTWRKQDGPLETPASLSDPLLKWWQDIVLF